MQHHHGLAPILSMLYPLPAPISPVPQIPLTREIWADDVKDGFLEMAQLPCLYPIVAVDCEFARVCGREKPEYPYPDCEVAYEATKVYVDDGSLVQAGFAFGAEENYMIPSNWQFSFNFAVGSKEDYAESPLRFLETHGHDINMHRQKGIDPAIFSDLLAHFPAVGNKSSTWVAFQGENDMAYLIQHLIHGGALPKSRLEFMHLFRENFPNYYDVKVLAAHAHHLLGFSKPLLGPLDNVAHELKVSRVGSGHNASSDALLTLRCFMVIKSKLGPSLNDYNGLLFWINRGNIPGRPLFLPNVGISVFSVTDDNLQEAFGNKRRILPALPIISVKVCYEGCDIRDQRLSHRSCTNVRSCYRGIRADIELIKEYNIALCIGNNRGQVGLNTVWDFRFSEGSSTNAVNKSDFANLLTSTGAVLNQEVIWSCFNGALDIAVILKVLLGQMKLPPTNEAFNLLFGSFFPRAIDIALVMDDVKEILSGTEVNALPRRDQENNALESYSVLRGTPTVLDDVTNDQKLRTLWGLLMVTCYHQHVLGWFPQ